MTHANAPLTPEGPRRIASLVVDDGWSYRRAAERFQCSPATAKKWADRFRNGEALTDRSSRPHTSPRRCPRHVERRVVNLRVTRRWGPHRIAYHLGIEPSLAWRVLRRFRMPRLAHLDQATGLPIRKPRPVRYERAHPGDLVHVDIKKLGRIPDGGGHRKLGRTIGNHNNKKRGRGYAFLHHAVDDHSRIAYSEILENERKDTTAGFWLRANTSFASVGITVKEVLTDNGSCYRSHTFRDALANTNITHRRTRAYRPQTNGKVERFNRTLAQEWAYATTYDSDEARAATYDTWLHHYNHHRPHTGIRGATPSERVHNLTGQYS
ncbi:IS481 family transposase [Pseudoclavibacter sp. RFBI5]|uniref:IS481 family transposase n=1 Tax=Pseudoclavibacter sp. RFBI5 TaxID=2080578 RepID=UPI000CE8919D|nr:IS481 family transposase [Pseudoclavibacter sp. RFBI5]PPG02260.1 IS481 family transposase [Pseudoclavibacter sp. RFBI5]